MLVFCQTCQQADLQINRDRWMEFLRYENLGTKIKEGKWRKKILGERDQLLRGQGGHCEQLALLPGHLCYPLQWQNLMTRFSLAQIFNVSR